MLMSDNHGGYSSPERHRPIFLDLAPGRRSSDELTGQKAKKDWLMEQLIHCGGAARDHNFRNLIKIADVDSGVIRWVNADLVTHIVPSTVFRCPTSQGC